MKKRAWLFLTCLFAVVSMAFAQRTVTGVVIDSSTGEPVIGASVLVKGTTVGNATNLDGRFTINNVPESAKHLIVSYIGMKQIEVAIKANMKIYMDPEDTSLDDVLVVAYGTQTKSSFTGSAAVVESEDIQKNQTSNPLNALTGKTAGVQINNSSGQPGSSPSTILVRGIGSINAGNAPLIVVDGTPYSGDLSSINSMDIENMTVLKDAASNALYGARGANGVIMITTKKGNRDAKVTVDAKWGVNSRATQTYNTIDNPAQYYEMYYSALKNYDLGRGASNYEAHQFALNNLTANNSYGLGYNVYNVPVGQSMIGLDGKFNPDATLGRIINWNGQSYLLRPDNWLDEAYKSSLRQEYNVNVTGGNEKSNFYASFGYLDNDGIVENSDYERITGRLKADYQAKSWLKVGGNMMFAHVNANSIDDSSGSGDSGNMFEIASNIAPIYPLYIRDANGNVMKDDAGNVMYDYGDPNYPGCNAGLSRPIYPNSNAVSDAILNVNRIEGNTMNASGFAEIRFLDHFKFSSVNTVFVDETRGTAATNPYYGQYYTLGGSVYKTHARSFSYTYQQILNYTNSFGKHNVDVMVGHEYYRDRYYYLTANKSAMYDPNNTELAGAVVDGSMNSYTTDYNTEGFFGRAMYDYNGKYFGSVSYRRDGSSRFHPDHRWGNFWSLGGAWILNKESWFDVDWVDMLKFKASYGSQGNDNIGDYRYVNTYDIVNSNGQAAAVPATMGNENITWETNGNFNTGFDFELFGRRLTGTIEFFCRNTTDMLFSFPLAPSFGYTSYYANIGDMRNLGIEAEFAGDIIKTNDLTWSARLNLTHYKNKITKLPKERRTMVCSGVEGFSNGMYFYGEGESMYTFMLPKYAGVSEDGQSMWYMDKEDAEGNITRVATTDYSNATMYLCGTSLPDVYGGFGTSFEYKGFDVSIDFAYQIGGQVYDSDYASSMSSPTSSSRGGKFHADLLKAWSVDNKSSNIPRFQYGDDYSAASSDRWLTDASYLSIQNINAGYTFSGAACRKLGLDNLRVYVSCDNVWVWSQRQGLDPRQSVTGGASTSLYAPIRTISGGLTVTF